MTYGELYHYGVKGMTWRKKGGKNVNFEDIVDNAKHDLREKRGKDWSERPVAPSKPGNGLMPGLTNGDKKKKSKKAKRTVKPVGNKPGYKSNLPKPVGNKPGYRR